jgi:uncharacterized protein (TIGR03118 family)
MQGWFSRTLTLAASLGLVLMFSSAGFAQYTGVLLDSNVTGHGRHVDPLLVNGWGLAYLPNAAFWVADAGSGWSTLYDGQGNPQTLQVIVPAANGQSGGSPTGIVANSSNDFQIDSWASKFIFATLDGTISGWSQFSPTAAIIAVNNSSTGASYTGLAITSRTSGNLIYAADTANGKVDIYDAHFKFVKSFTDASLPKNAVPFGIQDIKGKLLVAYCDASGGPGGVIDVFTEDGVFVKHFAVGAPLNQPWGMALAPANFGPLSNTLLVSNNLDIVGDINGFDVRTGKFVGTVTSSNGRPILIDQIWGIEFGGGSPLNGQTNQLFWAAGPLGNTAGAFGYVAPQ